tara:strand:+ start:928 stop:1194 length:267 start_codon:yes stop_codon:yes gene_type:complete
MTDAHPEQVSIEVWDYDSEGEKDRVVEPSIELSELEINLFLTGRRSVEFRGFLYQIDERREDDIARVRDGYVYTRIAYRKIKMWESKT